MTPRTRTETRSTPLRSPHQAVGLFLGAAILAVLIVAPSLARASFVARLAIDNPTAFDINVDVANGDGGGWFPLGTLDRGTESILEEVVDPGAMWVFHFSYGGVEGGELGSDHPVRGDAPGIPLVLGGMNLQNDSPREAP